MRRPPWRKERGRPNRLAGAIIHRNPSTYPQKMGVTFHPRIPRLQNRHDPRDRRAHPRTGESRALADMDRGMDAGRHTFVLDIPPGFERDVLAGRSPAAQLNVDATRQSQAQTGAALIREREHGTIEHLLVMPVTPLEIMLSKIWSMGVVVLVASSFSLQVVGKGFLGISVAGSTTAQSAPYLRMSITSSRSSA
ncbi:hypothetical protein p2A58 (plasmid) [Aromatoleum aromaticum EbN1]|uniref:Uncharacterized protein n=1 Tax=Aromatoleum aromaticum (strain DSM 19018 / LMG 30748 / EbN1) TaxID=76114 RepID=Q5NWK3_AROAE|nr:hypothetical protein p2A58 [Aromatoleum aromaticum EbN1]